MGYCPFKLVNLHEADEFLEPSASAFVYHVGARTVSVRISGNREFWHVNIFTITQNISAYSATGGTGADKSRECGKEWLANSAQNGK